MELGDLLTGVDVGPNVPPVMQLKHFERGEVLFREGETGREAYRIVSGQVAITITEGMKISRLGILYPGEILGEMAMIEDKPRAATARALTATVVEVITEENFMDAVVHDPERLKIYLGTLFERLRGMGVRLRQALRQAAVQGGPNDAAGLRRASPVPSRSRQRWPFPRESPCMGDRRARTSRSRSARFHSGLDGACPRRWRVSLPRTICMWMMGRRTRCPGITAPSRRRQRVSWWRIVGANWGQS